MAWRYHGRAKTSTSRPVSYAVCDRCGIWYNINQLSWQFQFAGPRLQNLRLLVCKTCLDVPQPQLMPRILPPDPTPTLNARPEPFAYDNSSDIATQTSVPIVTETADDNLVLETDSPPPLE